MNITDAPIDGLKIIQPRVFQDERGWFMESYTQNKFSASGIDIEFVQDNHAYNANKGILRGLHFQCAPKAQTKLVRCIRGSILDVAVDLRRPSETYKKWFSIELSAKNKKQLLIPVGFAHGYITLEDETEVVYKVDEFYHPESERTVIYNDPEIGIDWGFKEQPLLSEKDLAAPRLNEIDF